MNELIIKPSKEIMLALINKDYSVYSMPCFEHYNWCIKYLNEDKPLVTEGTRNIDSAERFYIQNIMIKACKKYLEDNE